MLPDGNRHIGRSPQTGEGETGIKQWISKCVMEMKIRDDQV